MPLITTPNPPPERTLTNSPSLVSTPLEHKRQVVGSEAAY